MKQKSIKNKKKASGKSQKSGLGAKTANRMEQTLSKIDALCGELQKETSDFQRQASDRNPAPDASSSQAQPRLGAAELVRILAALKAMMTELSTLIDDFHTTIEFDAVPTGTERRRLFGVRSRKLVEKRPPAINTTLVPVDRIDGTRYNTVFRRKRVIVVRHSRNRSGDSSRASQAGRVDRA